MKISVLTPDLSHNCLGRAYLLAKILQRHYEVEIVGPVFGRGIWEPLSQVEGLYKKVKDGDFPHFLMQIKGMLGEITGDVIYASKPLFASFGIGILKKLTSRKPLVLDIDDWQMGFMKYNYRNLSLHIRLKRYAYSSLKLHTTSSYLNNLIGEKLTSCADVVTVSNHFLKNKFGGSIIWHARDTEIFNPGKFNKCTLREKYGIAKKSKIVMFFGNPMPYKGVGDLIMAVSLLQDRDVILTLVGVNQSNYSQNLVMRANKKLGERFRMFGLQPFKNIPEFLAISDVIVIPQQKNFATVGQVPAKVFDAMAMAKPIIATTVCDLPEILNGCGWVVEPEKPEQLAQTIQYVVEHHSEAEQMGWKARGKCIEYYSHDAMENILVNIFKKYE